ncbi:hypothetical protein FTUN_4404 [Frigoriglobus tundricola]|uniref:Uncharacterized protein n=1 Tax=Frigoriglobus tundricola TaxID=2774151 RepID=A0A6M5YTS8_9BACT|nr:hypothetical protein FTUN_4404 [Frigoriglobus tundricola]
MAFLRRARAGAVPPDREGGQPGNRNVLEQRTPDAVLWRTSMLDGRTL